MNHLGMTGSREGMTKYQREEFLMWLDKRLPFKTAHHGQCRGADAEFHDIMIEQGVDVIIHPPIDGTYCAECPDAVWIKTPKPYLERNHDIVKESDILVAFPRTDTEQLRSGTWSTIRYARKIGKRVIIFPPNPL